MELDLRTAFSLQPGQTDALDSFIGHRLFEAGVWESPRTSDGIPHLRIVERAPRSVRACGQVYEIDQSLRSFWLDLRRETTENDVAWSLHFDVVGSSPAEQRNAIDVCDQAEKIDWRVILTGLGDIRDGVFVATTQRPSSERYTSPDGALILAVSRRDDGDSDVGFDGFSWHTHGDTLIAEYQLAGVDGLDAESAIRRLVSDVVNDRAIIAVERRGDEILDAWITWDPEKDKKYAGAENEIEFRHWDDSPARVSQ